MIKNHLKDILLIGSLTAVAVLSGFFDVTTIKSLAAVILGSIVIGTGIILALEK